MGIVYVDRQGIENLFRIGKTNNPSRRQKQHASSNQGLKRYRTVNSKHPKELEGLLFKELAEKRRKRQGSWSWVECGPNEIDTALDRMLEMLDVYVSRKQKVATLERRECTDDFLQASENLTSKAKQYSEIKARIEHLSLEMNLLELEVKSIIGLARGIDDCFTWKSTIVPDLDEKKLKKEYPEVYNDCLYTRISRRFLHWDAS